MPYIGNIVQDFSVNTAMLNTDSVTSIKIDDGTIVNADINDSAAIAGSKISPSFTSDLTITDVSPAINFTDSNNDSDFKIIVNDGKIKIQDTTNSNAVRFFINSSGTVDVAGNLDVGAGLDVTGAITGTAGLSIEGATVFNESGADVDFRVEGDTEPNLLFVDASADRVAIGTSSPAALFESRGSTGIMARFRDSGNGIIDLRTTGTNNSDPVQIDANNRDLTFAINSSEKMRINSSGLVNIGSGANASGLSPLLHLHKATSNATAYFHITNADTGISNTNGLLIGYNSSLDALIFNKQSTPIRFATAGSERMRIDSDGRVGIGLTPHTSDVATNITEGLLQINGNIDIRYAGTNSDPAGARYLNFINTDTTLVAGQPMGGLHWIGMDSDNPNSITAAILADCSGNAGTSSSLLFNTGGSERMRIDATTGKVGIGVSAPSNLLHVRQEINATGSGTAILQIENIRPNTGTGAAAIGFRTNEITSGASYLRAQIAAEYDGASNVSGRLLFHTVNSSGSFQEVMRLDDSGNVGIGTTSPLAILHLNDPSNNGEGTLKIGGNTDSTTTGATFFYEISGTTFLRIKNLYRSNGSNGNNANIEYDAGFHNFLTGTGGNERMRIGSDGKVGIGTTSPNRTLTVQSNGGQMSINDTDNTNGGIFCNAGLFSFYARGNSQLGDGGTGGVFEVQTHEGGGSTSQKFRVDGPGKLSTGGEGSPDVSGGGLCLNQGAADTNIFTCKSSDIAHGVTTLDETDTYFSIRKASGAKGGVRFQGFTDASGADGGFEFYAVITDDSAQSYQGMEFKAGKANGTGTTNIAANRRIAVFKNNDGTRIANITGTGITFGDDREAANALDDYEEGSWTPSIYNGGSPSYSQQAGLYTKIGNLVRHIFVISFSGASLGTNSRIQGLPFAYNSTFETSTNMGRIGTAWNDAESAGNRACHAVGHTGSGTQMIYVDLLTSGTDKTLRGFFEMRVP